MAASARLALFAAALTAGAPPLKAKEGGASGHVANQPTDETQAATSDIVRQENAPPFPAEKEGWSLTPFGRIQIDVGRIDAPDGLGVDEGWDHEIRRARLGLEGEAPGGFGYKVEVDFAEGDIEATDAFVTYQTGPIKATLGQHNSFQGLEELTSSRFISNIERAAFTDAFGFERRVGGSVQYKKGDALVQAGVFTDNLHDFPSRNWSGDGRVVFMPKLGDTRVHLGASLHYADLETGTGLRYRQRPAVHFTDVRFIDTGSFSASSELGLGIEAAAINGPLHVAAETYWQNANRDGNLADPSFFGGYGEIGYFLTPGDSRGYKDGKFDRTTPARPVGKGGVGAVQAVLRYDHLDLSDGIIRGGEQDAVALALIWTPTSHSRLLANYSRLYYTDAVYAASGGDRSYAVDAFAVRAQIDF